MVSKGFSFFLSVLNWRCSAACCAIQQCSDGETTLTCYSKSEREWKAHIPVDFYIHFIFCKYNFIWNFVFSLRVRSDAHAPSVCSTVFYKQKKTCWICSLTNPPPHAFISNWWRFSFFYYLAERCCAMVNCSQQPQDGAPASVGTDEPTYV